MGFSKRFRTDPYLENNGVWVDLGDGLKVLVARIGNEAYQKEFEVATAPYKHQVRTGTLPKDIAEKIYVSTLAKTVLLGWEGADFYEDGVFIPYSVEEAVKALSDPELKDFRRVVLELADQSETFRKQAIEAAVKN